MKRIVFFVLTIVIITFTTSAYCENSLEKYEKLLSGTWENLAYCGVKKDSHHIIYLDSFTYPGTSQSTITIGETDHKPTTVTTLLTGDDTGEVYLYITHDLLSGVTVGRVYLSSDGQIMLLKSDDGACFIFGKSN